MSLGSSLLSGSSLTPGRHSAYASDMDSYIYDRDRYGSSNLSRLNDISAANRLSTHRAEPNEIQGDRRRNLKDIRYSRDYEFIPRSEDLAYGGSRRSRGSLSPSVLDGYGADPRRTSPRYTSRVFWLFRCSKLCVFFCSDNLEGETCNLIRGTR